MHYAHGVYTGRNTRSDLGGLERAERRRSLRHNGAAIGCDSECLWQTGMRAQMWATYITCDEPLNTTTMAKLSGLAYDLSPFELRWEFVWLAWRMRHP